MAPCSSCILGAVEPPFPTILLNVPGLQRSHKVPISNFLFCREMQSPPLLALVLLLSALLSVFFSPLKQSHRDTLTTTIKFEADSLSRMHTHAHSVASITAHHLWWSEWLFQGFAGCLQGFLHSCQSDSNACQY